MGMSLGALCEFLHKTPREVLLMGADEAGFLISYMQAEAEQIRHEAEKVKVQNG
jgi:hypothetical protein